MNPDDSGAPRFFDLLNCRGCIDGPAFFEGTRAARLRALAQSPSEAAEALCFDALGPLPKIVVDRGFKPRPVEEPSVSQSELDSILAEAGLQDRAEHLDCAGCGYERCIDQAKAVAAGYSDWSACFLYRQRLFRSTAAQLKADSNTDDLTGLVNHRGFVESWQMEYNRRKRYQTSLSLMMVDVDNFKLINDSYGHLKGDQVLKLIAQLFTRNLRETDIVARYGGDEFAIILPEIHESEALAVAEKLRDRVATTVFWLGEEIKENVTLSIGVCQVKEGDTEPMAVLARADKALYRAKQSGRNQIVLTS